MSCTDLLRDAAVHGERLFDKGAADELRVFEDGAAGGERPASEFISVIREEVQAHASSRDVEQQRRTVQLQHRRRNLTTQPTIIVVVNNPKAEKQLARPGRRRHPRRRGFRGGARKGGEMHLVCLEKQGILDECGPGGRANSDEP